ncbi:MAG TPA: hypothetical protein VI136_20310 [Verrucomicrobiae bacterium]
MNTFSSPATPAKPPWAGRLFRRCFSWRAMRRTLVGTAIFATLLAVFYAEENWRGRRAWEQCKRDLKAKGELLDWKDCIPAPIPDDENIIKAPKMAEWFIKPKPGASLPEEMKLKVGTSTALMELAKRNGSNGPVLLARVIVVPADMTATTKADTVVAFDTLGAPERLGRFVQAIVGPNAAGVEGGASLTRQPLSQIKPSRIVLQTDRPRDTTNLSSALPTSLFAADLGCLRIETDGEADSFRLLLAPKPTLSAEEYLNGSDPCMHLDLIREALKRPHIRMDDDYQRPFEVPIVNFVAIRNLAQTAAQRAQCCLLLGRSEQAFRELSLNFELRRLLAAKPTTLVAAMIDVAITGLDAGIIAEGFRLQAWREPELVALQKQLREVNVLSAVAESFRMEPAAVRYTIETSSAGELARVFFGHSGINLWTRITDPVYLLLKVAPQGWLYQNLAVSSTITATESFDTEQWIIKPGVAEAANRELERLATHRSPYTILATVALPNYARATRTTARNQTLVNQALIVCGLERYRLAHGRYPEALDALVPQFVEKLPPDVIGGQPLKYRRTAGDQFLLYSVGWNEKDDGGQVVLNKDGSADREKGDWVWPLATK